MRTGRDAKKTGPGGVPVVAPRQRYVVTITYREPTYAQARGLPNPAYTGEFAVDAASPEEAIRIAERMFDDAQRESSVGWPREIEARTCRLAAGAR